MNNVINNNIGRLAQRIQLGLNANPAWLAYYNTYATRITDDSGTVQNSTISKTIYKMLTDNDLYDNTKLLLTPEGGIKTRTSGVNTFVPKAYDFSGEATPNDATQTTEASQPHLSGNIAPNEFQSLKNVNNGTRYASFPQIAFTSTEKWSLTIVAKWFGDDLTSYPYKPLIGRISASSSVVFIAYGGFSMYYRNESGGTAALWTTGSTSLRLIGKAKVFTFVANGSGLLSLYVDGSFVSSASIDTDMVFDTLVAARAVANSRFCGATYYQRIQSGEMTAPQVLAEYTALRSLIPEVESVTIGTQTWATSNLEMVVTPQGNMIQEMQASTATEKIAGDTTFNTASGWGGISGSLSISGGNLIYDGITDVSIATSTLNSWTVGKWIKLTLVVSSGSAYLTLANGTGGDIGDGAYTLYNVGTHTLYFKSLTATGLQIVFRNISGGTACSIDSISLQELGWANSQELYNGVYYQAAEDDSAVEKVTNGNFESGLIGNLVLGTGQSGTWTLNTSSPISGSQDGILDITVAGSEIARPAITFTNVTTAGKWYKLSFDYKVNSGNCVLNKLYLEASFAIGQTLTGSGTITKYFKASSSPSTGTIYFDNNVFNVQIDNYSIKELGISGQESTYEVTALKAAAMWHHYNNDTLNGAIYGKLYNWFAVKLLQNDIDAYNTANPTAHWGWHIPSSTELTTLQTYLGGSTVAGSKMKVAGITYWAAPNTNANNSSGFSALGCGISYDGTDININVKTWIVSSDYQRAELSFANEQMLIAAISTTNGKFVIRLLKD